MPDRVRESIFNILGARYGTLGHLPEVAVADVFAGSGSMGLEALSRGAGSCVFFERDPVALGALQRNITALQPAVEASVLTGDAWQTAAELHHRSPFDLIFLDPPYKQAEDTSPDGGVRRFLRSLTASRSAASVSNTGDAVVYSTLLVLHHPAATVYQLDLTDPWRVIDDRIIGSNRITLFAHEAT